MPNPSPKSEEEKQFANANHRAWLGETPTVAVLNRLRSKADAAVNVRVCSADTREEFYAQAHYMRGLAEAIKLIETPPHPIVKG